jgi:hypothetical protein
MRHRINRVIYAAGFFDGEGCVTTSHKNFRVTVANTNKAILRWLCQQFGGSINNCHYSDNPNWSPAWKWVLAAKDDVRRFLIAVEPFLRIKQRESRAVVKFLRKYPLQYGGHQGGSPTKIAARKKMWREFDRVKEQLRTFKTDRHYDRR